MWAVQPISFLWGYPAHILLVWVVQPISLEPIFFWVYPAHILLGLSSPYPFLGAVQPISFLWSYPAHILRAIQPISFLWRYPAYIFVGVGCPPHILSLWLSSPYSFGVGCPAHFFGATQPIFFWVYSTHILLGLSSPYPSLKLSSPYSVGVGCPAHILSLGLSSPYSFGVGSAHFFGAIQPIFFWVYPAHILLVLSSPVSFLWSYPAHILSLGGLSSPYLFFW